MYISITPRPPRSTLFPYTTLFRSLPAPSQKAFLRIWVGGSKVTPCGFGMGVGSGRRNGAPLSSISHRNRSEEHTSELQSRLHLVCRLLLEKKNTTQDPTQASRSRA